MLFGQKIKASKKICAAATRTCFLAQTWHRIAFSEQKQGKTTSLSELIIRYIGFLNILEGSSGGQKQTWSRIWPLSTKCPVAHIATALHGQKKPKPEKMSSNKKLLVTSATLLVTGALLVVTRSY